MISMREAYEKIGANYDDACARLMGGEMLARFALKFLDDESMDKLEAAMAAAKYKLDNLCAFVDLNGLQIDGETKDVMPTEPLDKKFEAFGWHVIKCDGHDFNQIEAAYKEAEQTKGQPTMILAKTIKGKGVSFMENNAGWHGKAPNDEQWAQAKAELEAKIKELEG